VKRLLAAGLLFAGAAVFATQQLPAATPSAKTHAAAPDRVDMELMTWVEIKDAMAHGKTTALIYNGGTEQRGPQAVVGGHTLVAHAKAVAIARKLGNALAAPVLPFSPNRADPALPGTIGITAQTFKDINEEVAEQLVLNGFKNVVLMGDHGGGQKELAQVASDLNAKYASQGVHVVFCSDAYLKSNDDFDRYIASKGLSPGGHASVNDTSEMMYLQPAPNTWIRSDKLHLAVGTPQSKDSLTGHGKAEFASNGVMGDGRASTAAIGKVGYDLHVDEAVAQIRYLLGESRKNPDETASK